MAATMISYEGEPYLNLDETINALKARAIYLHENGDDALGNSFLDVAESLRDVEIFIHNTIDIVQNLISIIGGNDED
jgi:hypothetical protein